MNQTIKYYGLCVKCNKGIYMCPTYNNIHYHCLLDGECYSSKRVLK